MPAKKEEEPEKKNTGRRQPAKNPADRMQQMAGYADALAEKQLLAGTASSQIQLHYLKQVTVREQIELEKLKQENILLVQKQELMASQTRAEDMMADVFSAMKRYAGVDDDDED